MARKVPTMLMLTRLMRRDCNVVIDSVMLGKSVNSQCGSVFDPSGNISWWVWSIYCYLGERQKSSYATKLLDITTKLIPLIVIILGVRQTFILVAGSNPC